MAKRRLEQLVEPRASEFDRDVCIVGGAGHVGLPLGIALASRKHKTIIYDINGAALERIGRGELPFIEYGAEPLLSETLGKTLFTSSDIREISRARYVIIAIGTPVDEYLNPKLRSLLEFFRALRPHLSRAQTIIIRSTVYPRTIQQVSRVLEEENEGPWNIAYCPERIAQGYAIRELQEFPQIVSGLTEAAVESASALFATLAPKILRLAIEEAELVKLFSNAWRYIQFATANQFYMMANEFGVDFNRVRQAMVDGYGRAASLPTAGFAAGPCLLKDTMQLAAFNNNNFLLGHAAMMINEGLPGYLVNNLRHRRDLAGVRVGILGMAFKGDVDDTRDSLSYKLGKILRFHGADVRYSDEFAKDPTFISKEELVADSEVVIVAVPHSNYRDLEIPPNIEVIDLWGVVKRSAG